ncbi:hypothetical protein P7K49_025533 [Saguinus oedipus]|uniref:Uncharacterized protein n=1 Tax=Saguinus oedipus TaxID=9490 RepID=A0ABQ9UHE7_SAGOE|nr:hypothetical protein P7K49_025533 [Saguinus oedipus]
MGNLTAPDAGLKRQSSLRPCQGPRLRSVICSRCPGEASLRSPASPPEKEKPVSLVGVTELLDAQKKQLKEQQEMQQLYDMIMQHKQAMQLLWGKAVQQRQQGYDSDKENQLEKFMETFKALKELR